MFKFLPTIGTARLKPSNLEEENVEIPRQCMMQGYTVTMYCINYIPLFEEVSKIFP